MSKEDFVKNLEKEDNNFYNKLYEKTKLFSNMFRLSRSYGASFLHGEKSWEDFDKDTIQFKMSLIFDWQMYLPTTILRLYNDSNIS